MDQTLLYFLLIFWVSTYFQWIFHLCCFFQSFLLTSLFGCSRNGQVWTVWSFKKIRGLEFGGRNLWLLPWWWFGISYCCRGVADDGIMEVGVIEKFQLWVHLSGISMIHRVKKGNKKSLEVWEGQVRLGTKLSVDTVEFLFLNAMGVSTSKVGSMHLFQVWVQEVQCARARCVQVKHKICVQVKLN